MTASEFAQFKALTARVEALERIVAALQAKRDTLTVKPKAA